MADRRVPVTITYQKAGTEPPFFVAGSFSDPAWEPQEMSVATGADGEHVFKKEVLAAPGDKLQYKFRVGHGEWWVLDESAPTVTDELGNTNNLLHVPSATETGSEKKADLMANPPKTLAVSLKQQELASRSGASTPDFVRTAAEVADSAALLDPATPEPEIDDAEAGRLGVRRLSSTPIPEIAEAAAEVADSAKWLDLDEDDDDDAGPPMLPHESFDATVSRERPLEGESPIFTYEDLSGRHVSPRYDNAVRNRSHSIGFEVNISEFDLNDPSIEKFPTGREEILNTVRKLETGLEQNQVDFEGVPLSPVVGPGHRTSLESAHDSYVTSPTSSPVMTRSGSQLDAHLPSDSPRRTMSQVSLQSIEEEDGTDDENTQAPIIRPAPVGAPAVSEMTPNSHEDEGVVLKHTEALAKVKTREDSFDEPISPKSTRASLAKPEAPGEDALPQPKIVVHRAPTDETTPRSLNREREQELGQENRAPATPVSVLHRA